MNIDHGLVGIVAGLIATMGFYPYAIAILKNKSHPSKASWIIWSVLGTVLALGYKTSGGGAGIWVAVSYAVCPAFILALIYYKDHNKTEVWSSTDKLCLKLGIAFFIPWVIFKITEGSLPQWGWILPRVTLYGAIAVYTFGAVPTIIKTWKNSESEDFWGWTFWVTGNWLNLLAIETWSIDEASYPIYCATPAALIMPTLILNRIRTYRMNKSKLT